MDSLSDIYVAGGPLFMNFISIAFIANIAVVLMVVLKITQKKEIDSKWVEAIKHLGTLALVLGAFGTIIGFMLAFDAMEKMEEVLPFNVISGGVKVALITVVYGLIVYVISLLVYILIKLFGKSSTPQNL